MSVASNQLEKRRISKKIKEPRLCSGQTGSDGVFSVQQHHNDRRDQSAALLDIGDSQRLRDILRRRLVGLILIPDNRLAGNVAGRIAGRHAGVSGLGQGIGLALGVTGDAGGVSVARFTLCSEAASWPLF